MSLKRKTAKGSLYLSVGEIVVYGSSFLRNALLARLLSKADFGIATTLALIVTFLEFSAKLGISRLIIADREGDKPDFLATAHFVQFSGCFTSALLILLFAAPLSNLFDIPASPWLLATLVFIPIFRGLEHLDIRRFERELRFAPSMGAEAVPQILLTIAAWPLAKIIGDFSVVLILLCSKTFISCLMSHFFAERPYRWKFDRIRIKRMLSFGWPIMVNTILMFGIMQGDQLLIPIFYTMVELAGYAAAAALIMAPTFFFARVFNSVMLPLLAKAQDDPNQFSRRFRQALSMVSVFSVFSTSFIVIGAEAIMKVVYGAKYSGTGLIMACLALAFCFRNIRVAPALAALAKGDSKNQMNSNLGRVTALLLAAVIAAAGAPLWAVACSGLLGEVFACIISFRRLNARDQIPFSLSLKPILLVVTFIALSVLIAAMGTYKLSPVIGLILALVVSLAFSSCMAFLLPELKSEISQLIAAIKRKAFNHFPALKPRPLPE